MIDKQIVESKLAEIRRYLDEISPFLKQETSLLTQDYQKYRVLERNFQLIVDTMLSINAHIIAQLGIMPSDDYQSTFTILGQQKIIPIDLAIKIAPIVGLRNKIVHQYGEIDLKKFIDDLKSGNHQFNKYIDGITKLIE